MSDVDAGDFLKLQKVAHVGTVDPAGWPYVVPLIYVLHSLAQSLLNTVSR